MTTDPYLKGRLINFEYAIQITIHRPPGSVCDMGVNPAVLILITREGSILRADLANNSEPTEIKIWKEFSTWSMSLHLLRSFCLFYSPSHNLLCLTPSSKLREFSLPKATHLSAISWTLSSYQMTPEKVLMASTNGKIFELEISTEDESTSFHGPSKGKINELASLPDTSNSFMVLPIIRQTGKDGLAVLVIFATSYSVYYYSGTFSTSQEDRLFTLLFDRNNSMEVRLKQEVTGFSTIWGTFTENDSVCPTSLVLVSDNHILHFNIFPLKLSLRHTLDYEGGTIRSVSLTRHNVVILTATGLDIISVHNSHVVYSHDLAEEMSPYVKCGGIMHSNVLWLASERNVFRFRYVKEERRVLDILVEQDQFDEALSYVREEPAKYDLVLDLYAEHLFRTNKEALVKSVDKFSRFTCNFEAMALRFVECGDLRALKTFLCGCYSTLNSRDTVKVCALLPWIVEVYLNIMAQCRYESQGEVEPVFEELKLFLTTCDQVKMAKVKGPLFELIRSHDQMEVLVFVSTLLKDYEELMNFHIQQRDYLSAVRLIQQPELDPSLLVKAAPVLVQNVPQLFVEDLIRYLKLQEDPGVVLEVIPQLVPAFVAANAMGNPILGLLAIRFLQTAIGHFQCRVTSVHDYYVPLLLEHDRDALMGYLESQSGGDNSKLPYSIRQTLFLCTHARHFEAACYLYEIQGLDQNAVLMALEAKRLDKAMEIARKSCPENQKKLFTKIIEWIVKSPGDVDIVPVLINLVNDGEMELDQVLPLIPDDCLVDTFKDAIVDCLKSYDNKITNLHQEIVDIDKMAEKLRSCCSETLKKRIVINPTDRCSLCSFSAIDNPFYVFPCTHVFHQSCLKKEYDRLIGQINESGVDLSLYDHFSTADDPECVFCSDLFIHMILVPFNSEEPY